MSDVISFDAKPEDEANLEVNLEANPETNPKDEANLEANLEVKPETKPEEPKEEKKPCTHAAEYKRKVEYCFECKVIIESNITTRIIKKFSQYPGSSCELLAHTPAYFDTWNKQQKMMEKFAEDGEMASMMAMHHWIKMAGWAPLQKELFWKMYCMGILDKVILSVGCGVAFNEKTIEFLIYKIKCRGKIICTDLEINSELDDFTKSRIEKLDAVEAVKKYSKAEILYISCPTYKDEWAAKALKAFCGRYLVYIGEGKHGASATDSFFELLEAEWNPVKVYEDDNYQNNWYGSHLDAYIYSRKLTEAERSNPTKSEEPKPTEPKEPKLKSTEVKKVTFENE